jgi:uncharacterized membrane protein
VSGARDAILALGRRLLAVTALTTPSAALVYLGAFSYTLACLYSLFRAGVFAFHDLGLTNDYLANTVNHGRLFWAADYGLNHLGVHFSPTLVLLTPLYALFDSQFVLLVIGTVALYAALPLGLRLVRRLVPAIFAGTLGRIAVPCLVLFFALNLYARTVLVAAHFEVLFLLGALAVLEGLACDRGLVLLLPLVSLAIGVREDAGLHLFGPILAVAYLAQRDDPVVARRVRRRASVLAAVALVWVGVVVGLVMPAFGPQHAGYIVQFWGGFGASPEEIVRTLVTSPLRVLREVAASGFVPFNGAFGWLAVLDPPVFLLINASGAIFYIASEEAKKYLWYYNSAFLLPGAVLGFAAGLARVSRWSLRIGHARALGAVARALPTSAAAALAAWALWSMPATVGGQLELRRYPAADTRMLDEIIARDLVSCPGVRSVASDFFSIVFLPNRYEKYMLINFAAADAVVLVRNGSMMLRWGMGDAALVDAIERSGMFERLESDARVVVYRRRGLGCDGSGSPTAGGF